LNPSYRPEVFSQTLNNLKTNDIIVVASHAEELIPGYEDDLYIYGIDNYMDNLNCLFQTVDHPVCKINQWLSVV
jgi:hypothetical protein